MAIITSLLDTDFYKFKMLYFLWKMGLEHTKVSYMLTNRSDIKLRKFINIDEFREELKNLTSLRLTYEELNYLETLFEKPFVQWLSSRKLGFNISSKHENIDNLKYKGEIADIILYETPIMAIINDLFRQRVIEGMGRYGNNHEEWFKNKLNDKISELYSYKNKIKFIEFGSRRRSSLKFQEHTILSLNHKLFESLIGTSNVLLAKRYNLKPMGTQAHEMFMLYALLFDTGLEGDLEKSQIKFINDWNNIFSETYYLTDTYGTDWFLKNCPKDIYGLRQDSGSPDIFMDKVDVSDFRDKPIMFSDGLDVKEMIRLSDKYKDKKISFGWGTNLTNDGLVEPLKIVIKLHSLITNNKEFYAVKLSDNPAKAIGRPQDIERYKQEFNYKNIQEIKQINY